MGYNKIAKAVWRAGDDTLSSLIDDMADVITADEPEPRVVYTALRKVMQPYMLGVYGVIGGSEPTTRYQRLFMSQVGYIPGDLCIDADARQCAEIWFWRLACLYSKDKGSKFCTYLGLYHGHKVRDALRVLLNAHANETLLCNEELDNAVSG